jgi:hypothetical protein
MKRLRRRSIQEARDEVERELNVRSRCFPRWIADGKVSHTDAQDRLDRMATALDIIEEMIAAPEAEAETPHVPAQQPPVGTHHA